MLLLLGLCCTKFLRIFAVLMEAAAAGAVRVFQVSSIVAGLVEATAAVACACT